MKLSGAAIAFLGAACLCPASATPLPSTDIFIYSDACETEGGDFAGFRVTLTRGAVGIRTVIEFNDEGPDGRDTARDVKFNPASGELSFSYRSGESGQKYMFDGTVSREKLEGVFGEYKDTLPAVKNTPPNLPDCR